VILMTTSQPARNGKTSKVEGPIRCHKCQLMCRDAEHYLRHLSAKCEVELSSDLSASRQARRANLG
jgi:hypothetical protein